MSEDDPTDIQFTHTNAHEGNSIHGIHCISGRTQRNDGIGENSDEDSRSDNMQRVE